jgi:DNA-directed RNA polymerase subunit RPC12/RpoP
MRFTVERATLAKMLRQLTRERRGFWRSVQFARLWACAGRVFVEANEVIAGTEALVLEDGSCSVPRVRFLKLVQSYSPKLNITIEANAETLRVETVTMPSADFSRVAIAPAQFHVFPVTDTWVAQTASAAHSVEKESKPTLPPAVTPPPVAPPKPLPKVTTPVQKIAPQPVPLPAPVAFKVQNENAGATTPPVPVSGQQRDAEIRFSCPQCGQRFEAEKWMKGTLTECPTCKRVLVVPQTAQPKGEVGYDLPHTTSAPPKPSPQTVQSTEEAVGIEALPQKVPVPASERTENMWRKLQTMYFMRKHLTGDSRKQERPMRRAVRVILRGLVTLTAGLLVTFWFWLVLSPIVFYFFNESRSVSEFLIWLGAVVLGFVAYVTKPGTRVQRFLNWVDRGNDS